MDEYKQDKFTFRDFPDDIEPLRKWVKLRRFDNVERLVTEDNYIFILTLEGERVGTVIVNKFLADHLRQIGVLFT